MDLHRKIKRLIGDYVTPSLIRGQWRWNQEGAWSHHLHRHPIGRGLSPDIGAAGKFSLGTGSQVTTNRPPRFSRLRAVGVAGANSPDTVSRKRIATCTPWSNCRRSIYLQTGWPLTMAIFFPGGHPFGCGWTSLGAAGAGAGVAAAAAGAIGFGPAGGDCGNGAAAL